MKKILAAVDGSAASLHAAKKARELSTALKAELTLVHVEPPTVQPGDMLVAPIIELREMELARGAAVLKELVRSLGLEPLPAGVKTLSLLGAPAETVAELAADQEFDLVVVGNKGRGAVSRMLLGSVADRLVHVCTRPVMVVR